MSERRIGVDATSWINTRGFGRFTRNAVAELVALDRDTTYVLFIDQHAAPVARLPDGAEQRVVRLGSAPTEAAAAESSRRLSDLLRLTRAARSARLDAILFPSLYTYFPAPGIPSIVGVHDTIADDRPEAAFDNARARVAWRAKRILALRSARQLFTVSAAARDAVAARFGIDPRRLPIVPEAPDPVFTPRPAAEVESRLAALGLSRDQGYVLYAGGISPHKNIERLLEAFALVRARREHVAPLVVVGDFDNEAYLSSARSVSARIAALELSDAVRTPGFVSDDVLACLYTGATAVVLPSLAEGFGLPAVEAASCGAALVLSDLPAHRESTNGAALYFDPEDTAAMALQLERVLGDEALRDDLRRRAREAVAPLTWRAAAEKLHQLVAAAQR